MRPRSAQRFATGARCFSANSVECGRGGAIAARGSARRSVIAIPSEPGSPRSQPAQVRDRDGRPIQVPAVWRSVADDSASFLSVGNRPRPVPRPDGGADPEFLPGPAIAGVQILSLDRHDGIEVAVGVGLHSLRGGIVAPFTVDDETVAVFSWRQRKVD